MADIRENLIDILRKTRYEYRRYIAMKDYEKRMAKTEEEFCAVDDSIVGEIPFCADHLITHGVTVQEWISVEDRMPEIGQRVLVWCESKTIEKHVTVSTYMTTYSATRKTYFSRHVRNVTHWMPLPEPPNCGADMRKEAHNEC